ncbi:arsenic resistance N-acetyltransferase ArsN2 [Gammaproteobacteria bacterium]|nr:arsenic resistance N-acetyltransferase ArsN2 [Gammaproteobacteria bacterium]
MSTGAIVELRRADLTQLEALLRANHLPAEDCAGQIQHYCASYQGDELVAAGAIEPVAQYGLLRSIVVREDHRGRGLARRMTSHLLDKGRDEGRVAIYLLTETAQTYFAGLGFVPMARADVPEAVSLTRQFTSLCPDSASCMYLPLRPDK